MDAVRILLVAADPLARTGLAALLAEEDAVDVIGQVAGAAGWDQTLATFRPDVIIWDLGWEGVAAEPELVQDPGRPLVILVGEETELSSLIAAGAATLPRSAPPGQIAGAVLAAAAGLIALAPELLSRLMPSSPTFPAPPLPSGDIEPLTPREMEVLNLLARGLTNKAIAQMLNISTHTVKFHMSGLLGKLNAQSRAEAVAIATRNGLLPL